MNGELARRFDNIIQKQLRVLIGDANGFDRLAQAYLSERCTNGFCRNNVGNWPLHAVEYHGRDRGLEFYTSKDDAMLQDADFGLFGWDGKSKGTLRNVPKHAGIADWSFTSDCSPHHLAMMQLSGERLPGRDLHPSDPVHFQTHAKPQAAIRPL
jgi:hypothetical protein